ncbi:hypothetical protein JK364_09955 [Streptomyces sp. 110]|uniref:Uncharacterized protein n=1 Tax=Streptomyces endocoffeicus TaxID=2898945 RepID=A0ABS1PLV5_9ACTN|nr:hypothetical protein [Streptomyces endocoffeicus]MBL1112721.1 hypothetical protein [Streptomyces endocoffeicus]
MTAMIAIAAENITSGRCHDRHGTDPHDDDGHEDGRNEGTAIPPESKTDSGTIRYPIAPVSIMGGDWQGPARVGTTEDEE